MKPKKRSFLTVLQSFFFTFTLYFQNNLHLYALSCAFGFLYSLIPTVIMVTAVLIRILHTSPEMLYRLLHNAEKWIDTENLAYFENHFLTSGKPVLFEIVTGITVFFLALRFFGTVMQSVRSIFHGSSKTRPLVAQLLSIAGEVILVMVTAAFTFVLSAFKSFFYTVRLGGTANLPLFFPFFNEGFTALLPLLFNTVPYFLLCLFSAASFRFASGTKPEFKLCFAAAFLCSLLFAAVVYAFSLFMNTAQYNLIYGFLGNLMIMLLEVSVFFSLFLFFAQYVYVLQFFDSLLLAELYLLPARNETSLMQNIRRMLFIRADRFLPQQKPSYSAKHNKTENEERPVFEEYRAGALIFCEGDEGTDVYYLAQGSVELVRKNNISYLEQGSFFGQLNSLLNEKRDASARAVTDVQLLKIGTHRFNELLNRNPEAVRKTMNMVADRLKTQKSVDV